MKKIIGYILLFDCICFCLPLIFTIKKTEEVAEIKKENAIQDIENKYDYKEYSMIKLLHTENNQIEDIDLDEYIQGVVAAEIPASFEEEALKAQAIVSRTYTIYKMKNNKNKHEGADICDSASCCQAWISKDKRFEKWEESMRENYWNKIVNAVNQTKGEIITYEGEPINAFFHANSGGKTESTINVWGGNYYPYLQTVETSGEENYTQYHSELTISKQTFIDKVKEKHEEFMIDFSKENEIKILEYTEGDRVKKIKIGNLELDGVEIRTIFGLKSANFNILIENENIKFEVKGYGHGVGMSQTGADSMAKEQKDYREIIKHFYSGVEITKI